MKIKLNVEILEFCQLCTPTRKCGWDCWIFKYKDNLVKDDDYEEDIAKKI